VVVVVLCKVLAQPVRVALAVVVRVRQTARLRVVPGQSTQAAAVAVLHTPVELPVTVDLAS